MLLVIACSDFGIHHCMPATPDLPAWRPSCTKSSLSLTIARVDSWVVVTQTRPTNGSRTGITGPAARIAAKVGTGSALKAALAMSKLERLLQAKGGAVRDGGSWLSAFRRDRMIG